MPTKMVWRGRSIRSFNKPLHVYVIVGLFALTGAVLSCLIALGLITLVAFPTQPTTIPASSTAPGTSVVIQRASPTAASDYSQLVNPPARALMNQGLTFAGPDYVRSVLGVPGEMTVTCSEVTNPKLKTLLITQDVGPNVVTGLKPAVEAVQRIYVSVKRERPDLYEQLAGQDILLKDEAMLCVRRVAGLYPPNYSLHAWGIAIDLTINRSLDAVGDGKIQQGLQELYPYFHAEGFYWGAAFQPSEDAMHFEVSRQLLDRWNSEGLLRGP